MRITNRERRDWTLIIFIIPIGIILMMIAGKIAVRIVPQWSVNAGMESLLDLQTVPKQQVGFVQPILPEILTPLGWFDTFLTPNSDSGSDIVFPPFVVFEPTSTPSPTTSPEPSPTVTETPTASASPSPSPSPSPTTVTTVPSATKTKDPDKTPTPPTPTATPVTPTATPPPVTSTVDPSFVEDNPAPVEIGTGTPDGNIGNILPGHYAVINISGTPVVVNGSSETNYDLVYYEYNNGGSVLMDHVILGISQFIDGSIYYEVFNWGDNNRDTNTNVDTNTLPPDPACTASPPECDNREIPTSELHPQPVGGTGILIDVDNAPSAPPVGSYDYIVVISPNSGDMDTAQLDSIEVTEVPPTP